jgi:hypothetical protein
MCFHRANDKNATVYTARTTRDGSGTIEWVVYQFLLNAPMKQLKSGNLLTSVSPIHLGCVRRVNSLRVSLGLYGSHANAGCLIHKVPYDEETSQEVIQVKVPREHVVVPLVLQGYTYYTCTDWTLHVNDDIDYNKIIPLA